MHMVSILAKAIILAMVILACQIAQFLIRDETYQFVGILTYSGQISVDADSLRVCFFIA